MEANLVLKEKNSQILKFWEKKYLESLVSHLQPFGNVLEIGFEEGYGAHLIQTYSPKSHTIIEPNPLMAQKAKLWAQNYPRVTIIEDLWENALEIVGHFETIFFKNYSLENETSALKLLTKNEIEIVSNKAKNVAQSLDEEIVEMKVQFSDQQLDEFYQNVGQFNKKELPTFFINIKKWGQISEKQYQRAIEKYNIEVPATQQEPIDPLLGFLEVCLMKNMIKGSRFSSFLLSSTSKYADSQFFERIITNPHLDYNESLFPIDIPNFRQIESLVMIIEKI